jgi:hypothetical protein
MGCSKTEFDCSLHRLLYKRNAVANQLPTSCPPVAEFLSKINPLMITNCSIVFNSKLIFGFVKKVLLLLVLVFLHSPLADNQLTTGSQSGHNQFTIGF